MPHDLSATDVLRGTCRWLLRAGVSPLAEVPLAGGRRADILGIDAAGRLTLVEIKVSLADLRGDRKWPDYLDHCDRFFWAVPVGLPLADLHTPPFRPEDTGVIVADRFDAESLREAPWRPLNAARRKAITLNLARRASQRWLCLVDPESALIGLD
ncbi:MmcB family DNA repair protein [Sandarakinorhabdus rubra]|uniref:MmcB family DNA repair protein n=1 Tax=Sandarakinorhabdus rubra TaxID=2672568 RepID=UPI0013DD1336|nr:MmcB family DNA repair protein [Sandarakinorhabdus rubra]